MGRSECICRWNSCESITERISPGSSPENFRIATDRRFCFTKDKYGTIIGGGVVPNDIPTCRLVEVHEPLDLKQEKRQKEKKLNHDARRYNKRHNL
jgi:hypothetical protein